MTPEKKLKNLKRVVEIDALAKKEFGLSKIVLDLEDKMETTTQELETKIEEVEKQEGPQGLKGEKGDKGESGEKGERGEQGLKGDKGDKGESGKDGKDGINGLNGLNGKDGKDGINGSPDTADDIRNKLELLDGKDRLKIEAIRDLREELDDIKKKGGEHIVSTSNRGLYQLLDVNIAGISAGQTIAWDGTQWIPSTNATTDEKVKYDVNDPTAGYLSVKIVAGTGITLSEGTGVDENKLKITNSLDLSGYVPYTGATSDVNIGVHNFVSTGVFSLLQDTTNAIIIGDITGDTRGSEAIDISAYRSDTTRVASGLYATLVGYDNIASNTYASALGYTNEASGIRSSAVGYLNTASNNRSSAFGAENNAIGTRASAFGLQNNVDGSFNMAFGLGNLVDANASNAGGYGNGNLIYAQGSFGFGSTNYLYGTNGYAVGFDNVVATEGGFAVGNALLNPHQNHFKMGNEYTDMSLNASGFSVKNDNPLSAMHITGKAIVTDVSSLGTELVTNGSFAGSATGWTLGTGWSFLVGYAQKGTAGIGTLSQSLSITAGKYYYVQFDIAYLSVGSMTVSVGGATSPVFYANTGAPTKTWRGVFKAVSTAGIVFTPLSSDTRITIIDNVSVKEITGGDVEALGSISGKGGLTLGFAQKSANYTLTAQDHFVLCVANSFTVTLPTASGVAGKIYKIKNSGSSATITVATTGGQTIDGATTQSLSYLDSIEVISNGSSWHIT